MTIEFSCSHCNKVLKTSDDKAGRRAKCPQCGEPITVPQSAAATNQEFDGFDEFDESVPEEESFLAGGTVREEDSFLAGGSIECPMCGAAVRAGAQKCQACGETLKVSSRSGRGHWEPRIISVGDVFSRSWEVFKSNLGMCMAVPLLAMLIYFLGVVVVVIGMAAIGAAMGAEFIKAAEVPLTLMMQFIFYLIIFYLQLGVQLVFLQIAKGEKPELSVMFGAGPYLVRMFLCSVIFAIVTSIGYLLLIVPGVILALMFWPFSYLLIDRNLPGIKAFTEAPTITKGNLLNLFGVFLATIGIVLLGGIVTLGIGLIFLFPYSVMVQTVAYTEMTSQ
ncbi:MAG: hypothetical protein KDA77_15550 [Planctomycetaceae bacterium]|nr:hypothetical protein [Planctomycetaceae bacterium]